MQTADETRKVIAETATTSAKSSQDSLAETKKIKSETNGRKRKGSQTPINDRKGKELALDDDEPDDAVAYQPLGNDDNAHDEALISNWAKRIKSIKILPEGFLKPFWLADFEIPPDISLSKLHDSAELFIPPQCNSDNTPSCGAGNDELLNAYFENIPNFSDDVATFINVNPDERMLRDSFERLEGELQSIMQNVEGMDQVLKQLREIRRKAEYHLYHSRLLREL
jgi:hypothetical protein